MGFSWIFQLAMFDETPRYRVGEGRSSGEDLQGNVWEAIFFGRSLMSGLLGTQKWVIIYTLW